MAKGPISRRAFLGGVAAAGTLPFWAREAFAQTGPPPPGNIRLVATAPPSGNANRQLIGGWRIAQEFARGAIAIDFSRMKLWMTGHSQQNNVKEYDLPPMGTGSVVGSWPRVDAVRTIGQWWPSYSGGQQTYANSLIWWRGKLWAAPRAYYAGGGTEAADGLLTLIAEDGQTLAVPVPRQRFSGFVKRGPGLDPLIGCGGYESGQGSQSGPSLATLAGQPLISYGWPALPGSNLEHWNERAPRDPNYYPANHVDDWLAWEPRMVNGQLQGRWASDVIYGGGLVLPEGITYWPLMGLGDLDYSRQIPTFAVNGNVRTYEYRYDSSTYQLTGYTARTDLPEAESLGGGIRGQELGPDGKVYLAHGNQWVSGAYQVDVALRVYG